MKHCIRILFTLIFLLCCAFTATADTLVLPADMTTIEDEAFEGAASFSEVVLPDGIASIGQRAFAYSGVSAINFPESLSYIAENAFEGIESMAVTAIEGTYAYNWAVDHGFIARPEFTLRLTCDTGATATAGSTAAWTAQAEHGLEPYRYLFNLYLDGQKIDTQAYSSKSEYRHTFSEAGEYYVIAKCKDDNGEIVSVQSEMITVTADVPVIQSIVCSANEIQTADPVNWTVSATGGEAPYSYSFALSLNGAVVAEQPASESNVFGYTFAADGDYVLSVTVTDAYQETAAETVSFSVALRAVEITELVCSADEPLTEESVTWTVSAAYGEAPYMYGYTLSLNGKVIESVEDSSLASFSFTFDEAGAYKLSVSVTDNCGMTASSAITGTVAKPPLEIDTLSVSTTEEQVGKPITWTVTAKGGSEPLRYAFDLFIDGEEVDGCAFSESNTFTYTPDAAGMYSVRARVRDSENITVKITGGEVTVTVETPGKYFDYKRLSNSRIEITAYTGANPDIIVPAAINGYTVSTVSLENNTLIETVVLPEGMTTIGDSAFSGCSSLTSINIPNSVTAIGSSAFRGCSSLSSINIPNSVTSIHSYAFYDCSSLTNINLPNSITTIGDHAFYDCSSLTSISIPNSITTIGDYAFAHCSSLTSINLPNSITTIEQYAFWGCSSLTSISIPNSVTSIGSSAFQSCSSLTDITIPTSVISIKKYAFMLCSSLTNITIPASVRSIGNGAFSGIFYNAMFYVAENSYAHTWCIENNVSFTLQ